MVVSLLLINLLPNDVLALGGSFVGTLLGTGAGTAQTEPEKWYYGSDLEIDAHIIFGEDRMYTEGKANRGFQYLSYGDEKEPLKHVFHIDIKLPQARQCNRDECAFFQEHIKG